MAAYDYVIKGGRVIDPANGVDKNADVAIRGGRIAAIADDIDPGQARQIYDARGQVVVPGLVDLHVHVYDKVTPLGVDADERCLRRGVTTVVDAGSAGYFTFPGFRHYVVERARCRVLAFLNISSIGLAGAGLGGDDRVPGELESLKFASVEGAARAIAENRDVIAGVKIRLSDTVANGGLYEKEAYRRALRLARETGLPLMVHHAFSTMPLAECPGLLERGDIYTHCFHGFPSTIVDPATRRIDPVVWEARERGVIFDIGHGQGSFNWTVAEIAISEGFWPQVISTDLHSGNVDGPAYDLPTVMTRLYHLGMPLVDVIAAATIAPARAIGWDDRIGTLGAGRAADITVLAIEPVDLDLEDCQSQLRRIRERIVARAVWRDGVYYPCTLPNPWPNPMSISRQRSTWERLVIRDAEPPAPAPF